MHERLRPFAAAVIAAWALAPARAYAASEEKLLGVLDLATGSIALVTAVVLLLVVLALRRVADGAAIAENISYVMAAVVCLASSVLLGWLARFLPSALSVAQARRGSELLVLACMVLLAVYFYRVRLAMLRYLAVFSGEELLAHAQEPGPEAGAGSGAEDAARG